MKKSTIMLLGSRSLHSFNHTLNPNHDYLVGDCYGADVRWQQLCHEQGIRPTVYHIGKYPRNNPHRFTTVQVSGSCQPHKDAKMFRQADAVIAAWDGKSKGTGNIISAAKHTLKPIQLIQLVPRGTSSH